VITAAGRSTSVNIGARWSSRPWTCAATLGAASLAVTNGVTLSQASCCGVRQPRTALANAVFHCRHGLPVMCSIRHLDHSRKVAWSRRSDSRWRIRLPSEGSSLLAGFLATRTTPPGR
jgi:hypothetical protein